MPDHSVEIGIVCTLELEAAAIIRRMGQCRKTIGSGFSLVTGILARRRVAVVRNDSGRSKLLNAADALISVHHPKWLIAAGFAVGIDRHLKRGELFVATHLTKNGSDATTGMTATLAQDLPANVRTGRLVSIAKLPRTKADKLALHDQSQAVAADQHSAHLGELCAERGVPFLVVRILIDDAARDAEPESRAVYHPSSTYRAGGLVGAFMSGSGHVGKIWKIRAAAKRRADELAAFMAQLATMLP